jgi:RNA polymerase sigma factor (sigma-70 family)
MNPTSTDSSQSIVVRAQREHEAALRRYTTRLLRDESRANDVVQEALLALGRQPEGERKALRSRLASWLFTVCRRKALNVLRDERRLGPLEEAPPVLSPDASPASAMARSEDRGQLLALVTRLPERQREVLRLRYHEGLSYQEISDITGCSVSHVGVILHSALQALRREWTHSFSPSNPPPS